MGKIKDARLKLLVAKFEMTPLGGWNLYQRRDATDAYFPEAPLNNVEIE